MRSILLATTAALVIAGSVAGCGTTTPPDVVVLAAEAMPCYTAVAAAWSGKVSVDNVLSAATVIATNSACASLDQAAVQLITDAINAGKAVVAAPAATPPAAPAA